MNPAAGANSKSVVCCVNLHGGREEEEGALFGGKFKLAHSFRENCIRSAPRHASKQASKQPAAAAAGKKRVSPSSGNSSYDS